MMEGSNDVTNHAAKGLSARSMGTASLIFSAISLGLYVLYFRVHIRRFHPSIDNDGHMATGEWLDRVEAISDFRFLTVIIALILAIMALRRKPRWIGWASLFTGLIAGFISTAMLM